MNAFLCAWDALEAAHPFGIDRFQPLFRDFGVPEALCEYVDRELYLDMMVPIHGHVRRFKIERRRSSTVMWMFVGIVSPALLYVAFQASPSSPFMSASVIEATPRALVEAIVGRHPGPRHPLLPCASRRARIV